MTAAPLGRVALVTGGDRGIGLAAARQLADAGRLVAVTNRHDPVADERIRNVSCDVTSEPDLREAVRSISAELGSIGILVANAGGATGAAPAGLLVPDQARATLELNLVAPMILTRLVLPGMLRQRWGRIIFISSVAGDRGGEFMSPYAAAKSGLVGFARSVSREVGRRGVTVNVVSPGVISTALSARHLESAPHLAAEVPVGRVGVADDVAAAVTFLASEQAGYITGVVLPVDGGLGMGR